MPKLNAPHSANGTMQVTPGQTSQRDVATFYQRADALYRCAFEALRQHERLSRLAHASAPSAERRAAESQVAIADEALLDLAAAYEAAATRGCAQCDTACFQAANALWHASREFARRQRTSSRAARLGDGRHSTDRLAELTLDYDLEASALLQLKQAAEGYQRVRPQAAA